jgi:hypothetical protein
MRVERADERHVARAVQREVLDIAPLAAEEARVLGSQDAMAEDAHGSDATAAAGRALRHTLVR